LKLLYPDRVLYIMAEEEAANYPIENIRDNYPKHYWEATSGNSWVRLHIDTQASAVGISNTNALQVDITIKSIVFGTATSTSSGKLIDTGATFQTSLVEVGDFVWNHSDQTNTTVQSIDSETQLTLASNIFTLGEEYSIEIGDLVAKQTYELGGISTYFALMTDTGTSALREALGFSLGYDYGYQSIKHNILIEFIASDTAHAGVIRAGKITEFSDPNYGLQESLKDFSIIKELNNGAIYIRKRNIVKTYSGKIDVVRDGQFYNFMRDVIQLNGQQPIFWWVSSNLTNTDWIVFGKPDGMPSGAHSYFSHSEIDFAIQEVV